MEKGIAKYIFKQTLRQRGHNKGEPYTSFIGCYDLIKEQGVRITGITGKGEVVDILHHGKNKRIHIGINKKKGGELNLNCQSMKKLPPYKSYISALKGTDIENPFIQRYHGDINTVYNPILIKLEYNQDTKERFLTILVFAGDRSRQDDLYSCFLVGLIDESINEDSYPLELQGEIVSSPITIED